MFIRNNGWLVGSLVTMASCHYDIQPDRMLLTSYGRDLQLNVGSEPRSSATQDPQAEAFLVFNWCNLPTVECVYTDFHLRDIRSHLAWLPA
jgi:hypothetical protein